MDCFLRVTFNPKLKTINWKDHPSCNTNNICVRQFFYQFNQVTGVLSYCFSFDCKKVKDTRCEF